MDKPLFQDAPRDAQAGDQKTSPIATPDIRTVIRIITIIAWINFAIGVPGAILFPVMHDLSLAATGWMAMLTFLLLKRITARISKARSWSEICVIAMCGVYFPSFIIWVSGSDLLDAVLYAR